MIVTTSRPNTKDKKAFKRNISTYAYDFSENKKQVLKYHANFVFQSTCKWSGWVALGKSMPGKVIKNNHFLDGLLECQRQEA